MKKILWMLCFVMVVVMCCVACNKDENGGENILGETTLEEDSFIYHSDIRYAERYESVVLSEAGIIYDHDDYVHLVTIDEGEDMLFCYDPNCTHPSAEKTDGDPKCMAAHYYCMSCRTVYYNRTLYFFVADGASAHKVYAMDTNGSGRKLLAELPFFFHVGYVAVFKDDKVYYKARIPYEDEITNVKGYKERIVELSLRDGSYRFITEESEDMINQASIVGDVMYMRTADSATGGLRLEMVNIKTLETRTVIARTEWRNGNRYVDAYDEDSYYYWDKNTYELGIKNIDGTIEEVILRGAEGEGYDAVASCDGIFYKREFDYGDEPAGAYFLDMKTREVMDITEETEKYKLIGYDGYYGVFISNGGDYMNWSLWSKEKVLGEALKTD